MQTLPSPLLVLPYQLYKRGATAGARGFSTKMWGRVCPHCLYLSIEEECGTNIGIHLQSRQELMTITIRQNVLETAAVAMMET